MQALILLPALLAQQGPGGPKIWRELDALTSSTATVAEDTPPIDTGTATAAPPTEPPKTPVVAKRGILGVNVVNLGGRLRIKALKPGGPAERAGLQKWDTLVSIDAEPVPNRSTYVRLMAGRRAGDIVGVEWRGADGELRFKQIELGAGRPALERRGPTVEVERKRRRRVRRRKKRVRTRRWYGWQPLIADAASLTLVLFSGQEPIVGGLGLAGYGIGAPMSHFFHGNVGKGLLSMGLRVGLPALTILGTVAICDEPRSCEDATLLITLGALATFAAIPAVDSSVLSWQHLEPKKKKKKPAVDVTFGPAIGPVRHGDGMTFGLGGAF